VETWRDNVSFVLVEPAEPGNIGSAARAIKNMGFTRLELVNPCDHLTDEARWLASNSVDILERSVVHPSLAEALKDKAIAVGTTRRTGRTRGLIMPLKKCAAELASLAAENRIAIVFGREDRGLTNDEIRQCSYLTTIPSSTDQPSLNLAQAVLLVAYELSQLEARDNAHRLVSREEMLPLFDRISRTLKIMGYMPRGQRDMEGKIMQNVRNLIGRSGLTDWELRMIQGLCARIEELAQGENGTCE